jgi:hypothetical protein
MWTHCRFSSMLGLFSCIFALAQGIAAPAQYVLRQKATQPPRAQEQLTSTGLDRLQISVDPAGTRIPQRLQQQIVRQFSRQSFCPPERRNEYAWVEPKPADGKIGLWLTVWRGIIENVTETSDGLLVKVSVWPRFANGGHPVRRIKDGAYEEVYRLSDGRLQFQHAIFPKNPGRPLAVTW